jgi:hypothetical protein
VEWLRAAQSAEEAADETARKPAPFATAEVAALRTDIVNSRARRPRGPPR